MNPIEGSWIPGPKLYESVGVIHIHSVYSDGACSVSEIAEFADQKKLDWIMLTDHCTLKAKEKGEEGKHGSVNVLVGSELDNEDGQNHYLAFGLDQLPRYEDPVEMVRAVREAGGFGAIAHPHEKRDEFPDMPPYPWTAWEAEFDGIEIWNQLSQWVEGLTRNNRLYRFLHPLKSLTRPDPETMAVWDRVNLKREVVGYVGVDAHALNYPLFYGLFHVKVFHYKVQFRSLLTHLLLEEPLDSENFKKAKSQILKALREGRHFGANHRLGNPQGFRFQALVDNQPILPLSRIDPGCKVEFFAQAPAEAELVLLRNGKEIVRVKGRILRHTTEKDGIWRVEVHQKRKGWIYSNPIRIVESDSNH